MIDHTTERNRSYVVRRAILGHGGYDGSGVAVTRRAISIFAPDDPRHVSIPAGTVCQVVTSNAGFRGIVCTAVAGPARVVDVSLGAFDPVPDPLSELLEVMPPVDPTGIDCWEAHEGIAP